MKNRRSAPPQGSGLRSLVLRMEQKAGSFLSDFKSGLDARKAEILNAGKTGSLVARGKMAVRSIDYNSRQAVILQYRCLLDLMEENKDTEYGKKYCFADVHTVEDFQRLVPFTTYDDYEPYIRRMMDGEVNLLCVRPPKHYALTSGSVGVPKHVPVTQRELDKYASYTGALAFGVADEYYVTTTGKGIPAGSGLNAIEMKVMPTGTGVDQGSISGTLMSSMKDYVPYLLSSPWEVVRPAGEMDMKYIKARLALADRNLVFMDSAFMTGLVDLMDYIRSNYRMLCRDIWYGQINKDVRMPEDVRQALSETLVPDRERAKELMLEFQRGFDTPIIPRIWPRMSWIGGIGTGGFASYARRMRKYSGKSIPFNNLCYAASESLIAAARHMGDESFVLIPDGGFYEFIPINGDESRPLTIEELEVGEDYEIVVTNLSGFYRYRIGDIIRVTGFYNETPMLRFIYRKNLLVSIAGEKTNEEALQWAVTEFSRATGIRVIDYSVFADEASEPGHYVMLLEPEQVVKKESLAWCRDVLESKLMQANPSYGDMIRTGVLSPMELVFLQQQTYQLYRDLMDMKGVTANQQKPVRVIDTPAKEHFFFGLAE